jgi:hypothetical protein
LARSPDARQVHIGGFAQKTLKVNAPHGDGIEILALSKKLADLYMLRFYS